MFAIIDIETSGPQFKFGESRIIEICIVVHDGLSVVDKFTSLINPDCFITSFYTKLTGISNEMVKQAPRFHEIAPRIIELTANCIFVAHNVIFDYTFIKEEFASLGYKYKRDTLCTVRLARKMLPGHESYSLGKLCKSLGIPNQARHRAEGDALATAQLFDLILEAKNKSSRYRKMGVHEIMVTRAEKIKKSVLEKIPETCGVYYFIDEHKNIIYIGKSNNMYGRAINHFGSDEKKAKSIVSKMVDVDFIETGSELLALLLESNEIKKHQPLFNKARIRPDFSHSIRKFMQDGIVAYEIVPTGKFEGEFIGFTTLSAAKERLIQWTEEFQLCQSYTDLWNQPGACFDFQLKKCKGVCCEKESVASYNKRALKIFKDFSFKYADFVIVERGRNSQEQTYIVVTDNKVSGYFFAGIDDALANREDVLDRMTRIDFYPDLNSLLKSWIRRKKPNIKPI